MIQQPHLLLVTLPLAHDVGSGGAAHLTVWQKFGEQFDRTAPEHTITISKTIKSFADISLKNSFGIKNEMKSKNKIILAFIGTKQMIHSIIKSLIHFISKTSELLQNTYN